MINPCIIMLCYEGPDSVRELQLKLQQMSDIQPVTLPNPPKIVYSVNRLSNVGGVLIQGAVPSQQHWNQVHAIKGVAGVQLSERAHALQHRPLTPLNNQKVGVEPCKR
jgi:hypothetical protein